MLEKVDFELEKTLQDQILDMILDRLFGMGYEFFCKNQNSFELRIPNTMKKAVIDFSNEKYTLKLYDQVELDGDEVFNLTEDFYSTLTSVLKDEISMNLRYASIEIAPVIN